MLARRALVLVALLIFAGPAVAPSALNVFVGRGTLTMTQDGVACGPADAPILVAIGVPNGASERASVLAAPGEGGVHAGSGSSPDDPLVSSSCVLGWTGYLVGSAAAGFAGVATDHVGPDPDCQVQLVIGPVGPASPVSLSGCGGALVGSGTLDFSPFLTS